MYDLSGLNSLCLKQNSISRRASSYDRTGGNDTIVVVKAGCSGILADIRGAGCIRHIWCTVVVRDSMVSPDVVLDNALEKYYLRKLILRIYWDGEEYPSVEAPLGDFFGLGHGICKNYISMPLQMSPKEGKSFNCWFPMPYDEGARVEILNECDNDARFYYYIDYDEYKSLKDDALRFHASWNRENPTCGISDIGMTNREFLFGGRNTTGDGNYIVLEAEGQGHYVGCNVNIHNLRDTARSNWPGEGCDMIFIDGEPWPPSIYGTGTENYMNMGWCPQQEYCAPYHGMILTGGSNWSGKISFYRYHILDPIRFGKSIKVTLEHGHNNHRSDDWSSTAYWYQTEPHKKFRPMQEMKDRLPIDEESFVWEWK